MRCPHDETVLQMTERHGIEIDYCPNCRGVWLDRGELDKIIAQAGGPGPATHGAPPPQTPPAYAPPPGTVYPPTGYRRYGSPGSPDSPDYGYDPRYGDQRHRRRRKGGFLGDLFDF